MSKNDTENSPENEDAEKGKILGFKDWLACTRQNFAKSYARLSSEERWRVNALGVLGAAIGLKNISWLGAAIAGAFFWLATICYYILTKDQRRSAAEKSMRFQPYATLGMFIRCFPHVVGTTAFTALFVSPMTSSDKVFFGSVFILLAGWRDINEIIASILKEEQESLAWLQILTLERSLKGEAVNWNETLEKHRAQQLTTAKWTTGDGDGIVLILLIRYVLWVVTGWLISKVAVVL